MNIARIVLACLLLSLVPAARALRLDNPYTVEMPVASQSVADRQAAEVAGLRLLLERLSGQQQDGNAVLKSATGHAEQYVQQFSYQQEKPATADHPLAGNGAATSAVPPAWRIRLVFLPAAVNKLLEQAGIALWPLDRPQVLLLMVNEKPTFLPLPAADGGDAMAPLRTLGQQRGVPLVLPDPTDLDVTVAAAVQALDAASLQTQVATLKADAMLLGNVHGSDDKGWSAQWLLQYQGQEQRFAQKATTLPGLVDETLRQAARVLSANYQVGATTDAGPAQLRLQVDGVRSYAAFVKLQHYFETLEAVQHVDNIRINGTTVVVDVAVKGRDSFRNLVTLFKSLQWQEEITPPPGSDASVRPVWRYQWVE